MLICHGSRLSVRLRFDIARIFLISAAASVFVLTAAPEQNTSAPEVSTQEDVTVFQSKVTLIEVPVVVRDKNGKAVGTLRQEDFQLFDKGKPQVISKFSVERPDGGKAITQVSSAKAEGPAGENTDAAPVITPDHFVAFLYDDLHMAFADLVYTRKATQKYIDTNLKPGDRVGIFTTSGRTMLEFTDDRDLLNKAVLKIAPVPMNPPPTCPGMTVTEADRIYNTGDSALQEKKARSIVGVCATDLPAAMAKVLSSAALIVHYQEAVTRMTFSGMSDTVGRMSQMPGQRTLVLASSGFHVSSDQLTDAGPVIDRAIKAGVIINTLDARGLTTQRPEYMAMPTAILAELAEGTGGRFIENTNDLTGGIRELAAAPEAYYVLGFSPQNLKTDGTFHSLKVSLKTPAGMSVQARRGYYAPTHLASAEEDAKQEISQALFSRDETNDIPVEMNTRFFKASETQARLSVTSRVDVRKLRFRKANDRNVNDVRVVCALFDRDGNYVQGISKTIQLRLLNGAIQNEKLSGGISVRSDFTVAPGTYVIRLVVRDAEGETMTARNSAVRIP